MPTVTETFTYTGADQAWEVPDGVTECTVECWGAQGAAAASSAWSAGGPGGQGGYVKALAVPVTPGESLTLIVGGQGAVYGGGGPGGPPSGSGGGTAGARGGGRSEVKRSATRLVVAGGGGGGGGAYGSSNGPGFAGGSGGATAGSDAPGAGVVGGGAGASGVGGAGGDGSGGDGTAGTATDGGTGGGGAGGVGSGGGGGGGGGYGAGGGGSSGGAFGSGGAGGGGGDNAVLAGTLETDSTGVRSGNGAISITYVTNTPPDAAILTTMTGDTVIDRAKTNRASHVFSDTDPGDSQSKFDHRHRAEGDSSWTTTTHVTPNTFLDFEAGTLTLGRRERQVLTYDALGEPAGGVGTEAWSESGFFTVAEAPPVPAITAPINGATIASEESELTWSAPNQDKYQVRVVADDGSGNPDTAVVDYDSGEVPSSSTRSVMVPYDENNTTKHTQVRTEYQELWSSWGSVSNPVAYTKPMAPLAAVAVFRIDGKEVGLRYTVTNPEPTGGEPAVTHNEGWRREKGDTGNGIRRSAATIPNGFFDDDEVASDQHYEVRFKAIGDNGATAWSDWVDEAGPVVDGDDFFGGSFD